MERPATFRIGTFNSGSQTATTVAVFLLFVVLTLVHTQSALAQNYHVLYNFSGRSDGSSPWAGLAMDVAGNLYGTTTDGGGGTCLGGCGTVYELSRTASGWSFSTLYRFQGGADGSGPRARVTVGPDGALYGTTPYGGVVQNLSRECAGLGECGTVFKLTPGCIQDCDWTKTTLHSFGGPGDGGNPVGTLVFDRAGNLYGATAEGGTEDYGIVYELTPNGGDWTETVLHNFEGSPVDGELPWSGPTLDAAGNLYGTAQGRDGVGVVYELSPAASGWNERILYIFENYENGQGSLGGVIFDGLGNMYGGTFESGYYDGGTAYELSPSNDGWSFTLLASFSCYPYQGNCNSGQSGVYDKLAVDRDGNLYGTTNSDGPNNVGTVFKLTPSPGGGWTFTDLFDFSDNPWGGFGTAGLFPYGGVAAPCTGPRVLEEAMAGVLCLR